MPDTRTLSSLFRALAEDDVERAVEVAGRICRAEERHGHRGAARVLRGALHRANGAGPLNGHGAHGLVLEESGHLLSSALSRLPADVPLDRVVLPKATRSELLSVIQEWEKQDKLRDRGLAPRSKLLFHGPSGCGKSYTARALAHALKIPVYVVRFDAIIGAYLGQTAARLRQVFHFAETSACVILLDEIDALGKRRGSAQDVGELDRIVIALLQELEHSRPRGLVVGTSNTAKHLDDALWRRFDLSLHLQAPSRPALVGYSRRLAEELKVRLNRRTLDQASRAGSFARAEAIVLAEARRQILRGP